MVSGSDRHPYSLAGMGTGFDWRFWVFVSCKLWFQYLTPDVCSQKLPQGSRGRQGQPGRDEEAQLWQWKWNEYSQCDVPVPALLLELLWWVLPAQQMASTERLWCQWKITEFCWSCACMWMCEGGSGENFHYLIIFKRERETNGSLRLKKLLAYKEPVSCFRGMRHVCLLFEFSVWFHLTFLISQDCEFFSK